jgi:hypothetical protein
MISDDQFFWLAKIVWKYRIWQKSGIKLGFCETNLCSMGRAYL